MKEKKQALDEVVSHGMNEYCNVVAEWSKAKGFWAQEELRAQLGVLDRPTLDLLIKSQKIMLMVTELAELLEGLRKMEVPNEGEELADAVIRIMDYCGHYDIPLGSHIVKKMQVNEVRPHKHGKAF